VREVALGAYAHQDLPFEKLVQELQGPRDLGHNPLFQVMFVLKNVPRQTMELSGLQVSRLEIDNKTAKFDLTLSIFDKEPELVGWLEYNTDLFDDDTIKRLLGHFQVLLEGIVADPAKRVAYLPLLTNAERQQLADWNNTAKSFAKDKC